MLGTTGAIATGPEESPLQSRRKIPRRRKSLHDNDIRVSIVTSQPNSLFCKCLCLELVLMVFNKLDMKSRCRLARVCKDFRRIIYSIPDYWKELDLSGRELRNPRDGTSTDARILDIASYATHIRNNLTAVNLSHSSITGSGALCQLCSNCPDITYLDLSYCFSIDTFSFPWLMMLKKLRVLKLTGCTQLSDFAIKYVFFLPTATPNLEELYLNKLPSLTPTCLVHIRALSQLQVLDISGCTRIIDWRNLLLGEANMKMRRLLLPETAEDVTDQHIELLANCFPDLQSLDLYITHSENFTGETLQQLPIKCPKLLRLHLRVGHATGLLPAIHTLKNIPELSLEIHDGEADDPTILEIICNCPNLTTLSFSANQGPAPYFMTDSTLEVLTEMCPNITRLQIYCDELSPLGLRSVTKFQHLNSLSLTGAKLCNANMRHFASGLPKLTEFSLIMPEKLHESAKISTLFKGLSNLKRLELVLDFFTDKDLETLGLYCTKLEHIELLCAWNFPLTLTSIAKNCKHLKTLKLAQEKAPPARIRSSTSLYPSFATLAQHQSLTKLSITGSLITDASLLALSSLPLHTLHLADCTSITIEGLRQFTQNSRYLRNLCLVGCFGTREEDEDDFFGVGGFVEMEDGRLPDKEREWFKKCGVKVWESDLAAW